MTTDDLVAVSTGAAWTIFGGIVVSQIMFRIRGRRRGARRWRTGPLGLVERAVYFGATLANTPEVIGGWLVLKVASQWGDWGKRPGVFNTFAIGTGLNVVFGVTGALLALALERGDTVWAFALTEGPLVLCILILVHTYGSSLWRIIDPELMRRSRIPHERPTDDQSELHPG